MQRASFFDTLESEPETVPIIANPTIAPYVLSLVERPMLEQFSLTFMFRGGEINAHAGHTPYQSINSYQVNDGRIYCNHLRVMYYLTDVIPGSGDGGLFVLPVRHDCGCIVSLSYAWHLFQQDAGEWMVLLTCACILSRAQGSHKAEFPFFKATDPAAASLRTMDEETKSLFVEIGGCAGTAIVFTHDLVHCSFNEHGECRSVLHTACVSPTLYIHAVSPHCLSVCTDENLHAPVLRIVCHVPIADNNAQFTRGWLNAHTNYAALHEKLEPGTWQHYLTRDPDYVDHAKRPTDSSWPTAAAAPKL